MKLLTAQQTKEADAYTIKNEPVASIDLMERAATACIDWILERYQKIKGSFIVFAGPGNNGGDGLAIARYLAILRFPVKVNIIMITNKFSGDFSINRERLKQYEEVTISEIKSIEDLQQVSEEDILIDAIFGSGLSRPLGKLPAEVAKFINQQPAKVIAVDIPSGLFAEEAVNGADDRMIVQATDTLTFQFPKLSFFFKENHPYVGRWHMLPIGLHPDFIHNVGTPYHYIQPEDILPFLKARDKFSHKGTYGKGLLIAGSYGMMGAAILSTKAAIRSGIGLLTVHVPHIGYNSIQGAVPEALVSIDESDIIFTKYPELSGFQAVGAGPALGLRVNSQKALRKLLEEVQVPLVLDADALNILGKNKEWLDLLPPNTILTPHPKEFERIHGPVRNTYERLQAQLKFSRKYNVFVVLKGAHTSISTPGGECYFNSTGNPGMATGGTGDVLTGIILSLLAQQYDPLHAAVMGVYLHGLAGDIAAEEHSGEALIASDVTDKLGEAFNWIRKHGKKDEV